jgi:1,4-dihydroxy-6-naphthoate synthase
MKNILVAHSQDADDIFMYYAIKLGWVSDKKYHFDSIMSDIQTLNNGAKENKYDICAISFALYPKISSQYTMLKTAISFGEGYGPKLVKRKNTKLYDNFTVALSGEDTTNAMLFKIKYPNAKIKYINFLEIQQAILDKKVDAGVLIHESILNFDNSLEVEAEIFDIWNDLTKDNLPLPLGCMAIKKSIPLIDAINYEEILTKAVYIATKHKAFLSHMLFERDLIRVNKDELKTYLNMYANNNSITLSDIQNTAINTLYKIGFEHKFFDTYIQNINDYFLPKEYKDLTYKQKNNNE